MAKRERSSLSTQERALLEEILTLTWRSGAAVDGTNFRITHQSDRKALQDLEFRSLLVRERQADAYRVALLGLDALRTDVSRRILTFGDKLAAALQQRFSDESLRHEKFFVVQIAECLGISVDECKLVLLHLREAVESWWGGASSDWLSKDAWILPGERVFEWPTTGDFISQLKDWRSPERRAAKDALRATLLGHAPQPAETALREAPAWHQDLRPRPLRALFAEIHRARQVSCPALVVLGLRAAIDTMCNEMWGDLGTFQAKLQKLNDEGFIGRRQRDQISAAIEIGNATTHRGHIPTRRDADTVHDIVEALLKQHYSLSARASSAAKRVPARVRPRKG